MNKGQKYNLPIENLLDAYAYHQIITDNSGKPVDYIFLEVNPAFEEMTGLSRDKVIGKKVKEVLPEIKESAFDWIGTYGEVALNGKRVCFEQYSEHLDRWYDITAYSDNPGFFAVVFRDISEWKQLVDAMRTSERLLNESQAISKVGGWEYDVKTKHIIWTDEVYRIYGVTKDYDPSNVSEDISFYSTADQNIIEQAFWSGVNQGVPYDLELRFKSADGTAKWVRTIGKPLLEDGVVTKVIGNIMDISERKETEATLKDHQEELAAIYENAPITMMLVDKNHKIVKINGYATSFFGKPLEEMIGKRGGEALGCLYALDTPEGCGHGPRCNECTIRNTVLDTMETGKIYHQVEANRPFIIAGQEKELFFLLSTTKVNVKNQTMVLVCLQDITKRKNAEEALQASEANYRSIFNSARDILIIYNKEGIIIEANEEASRSYGYSRDEFKGMNGRNLAHPDYRYLFDNYVKEMQQKGYFFTEAVDIRKDGSPFNIEVNGSSIIIEGKEHMLAIVRDISDRKQAEIALRRREEEFRALAENALDIVARFDHNLRYLYVNPAVEQHTGIPREDFIGRTSAEPNMPEEQTRLRNSTLLAVFQGGREQELYYDHSTPTGRKYYHSRLVPEFAPDGTVETVLSIARDITAIKEMEVALYKERVKTYRMHQHSLPDELPGLPGLNLAASYRPAVELQGDYYNAIRRHNQLLLYLVDIEKGRDDGVMQSLYVCKTIEDYLLAHADNVLVSPALLLRYVTDRYQQENQGETSPICVFIAVFDLPQVNSRPDILRYASINFYTSPLIITGASDPDGLSLETLSLPPDDGTDLLEYTLTIVPGDTFIFSNDGLFNQSLDRVSYEQRLQEILRSCAQLPPELIKRAVETDFDLLRSNLPLQNDLAFIVAQVPQQEQRFSFKIESDFNHIDEAKEQASTLLEQQMGHEPDLIHFHELLVNAIEHGNKRDGGKSVTVEMVLTERYYKVIITDQGEGFNWRERINKELDWESKSERGRGIIMTRIMTDYLSYNGRGNRVTMIKLLEQY